MFRSVPSVFSPALRVILEQQVSRSQNKLKKTHQFTLSCFPLSLKNSTFLSGSRVSFLLGWPIFFFVVMYPHKSSMFFFSPRPQTACSSKILHRQCQKHENPRYDLRIWVFPKIMGFPPKSSIFNRVFHYKPSILGYPYFWKHPFQSNQLEDPHPKTNGRNPKMPP